MNELKAHDLVDIQDYRVEVYLKSEADKVIAELEMKLARAKLVLRLNTPEALYSNLETMSRLNHEKYVIERRERHHKYKRCLAMAKWCYSMDCRMLNEASDNGTYFKESWCWKRASWYGKWKRKWLELAEQFEEAK